ncbi:malonate decarboxylase acyl carrier protein [Psychrobacter aquaticus]|uniref:Malonate decarboxylase acyl carrier protein n=1 Tax=Psychrobacter aquaticus CMS 56 TaxID=1354303 RepID=U4T6H2_9GAMM|nr:malonate decarboxylase acyl carrier protein [Psychrobacter aquaticus]ERL56992.1 Malonate decarboxylase delta subunit [Psychrobacter aquaticus CMS 56]
MNVLNFDFTSQPIADIKKEVICGVVGSGNLEVLVSPLADSDNGNSSKFIIDTSVTGFDHIWEAVLQDFSSRYAVGGLEFKVNDMGATPAVVSLRLSQAINILEEESHG